jgi:hypothetical protein
LGKSIPLLNIERLLRQLPRWVHPWWNGRCSVDGSCRRRYAADVEALGKLLVGAGLMLMAVGLWFWLGVGKERGAWLPGDVFIDRGGFKFYFPIVTCLLVSALLSFLCWLFRR